MIFENSDIYDGWHETRSAKESAMKTRLVGNCERMEAHSKELEPLREGDFVFIQNQIPNSARSNKWDKEGKVISIGKNDQYLIKVAGTGRLTLRNRRFLRKFKVNAQTTNGSPSFASVPNNVPLHTPHLKNDVQTSIPLSRPSLENCTEAPQQQSEKLTTTVSTPQNISELERSENEQTKKDPDTEISKNETPTIQLRRSSRVSRKPQLYDVLLGK